MAIEKGLYAAPLGMEQLAMEEEPLEIAIEDPESVEIGIGGVPILRIEEDEEESDEDFSANLAEYISEQALQTLASELTSDFDDDVSSRKDWMQTYVDGLEL